MTSLSQTSITAERLNTTRRIALRGVKHFNVEKYSNKASYRVRTDKFFCTLIRDTDVPHFIEISR